MKIEGAQRNGLAVIAVLGDDNEIRLYRSMEYGASSHDGPLDSDALYFVLMRSQRMAESMEDLTPADRMSLIVAAEQAVKQLIARHFEPSATASVRERLVRTR